MCNQRGEGPALRVPPHIPRVPGDSDNPSLGYVKRSPAKSGIRVLPKMRSQCKHMRGPLILQKGLVLLSSGESFPSLIVGKCRRAKSAPGLGSRNVLRETLPG